MSYIGNKPADKLLETGDIADLAITTGKIAEDAVTLAKLAKIGTAGEVLTSSGVGVAPVYSTVAKASGVIYENNQTITADYTLAATKNGLSAGPITINTGVTVTIATGATWTIV